MATAKAPTDEKPVNFSTLLQPDVAEALRQRSFQTQVPKTKLIDRALRRYLKLK